MMFFTLASLVAIVLWAISAKAAYFNPINPTEIIQCEPLKISYNEGEPPFIVSVWDGCNADATTDVPKEEYHTSSTTVFWTVNVLAGESIMFGLQDKSGSWYWTDDFVVESSKNASCVGMKPSFSSPGSTNPGTPTTQAPGNVGGPPTTTLSTSTKAGHIGGIGGALSNFSPRVELAALVVVGSCLASLLF